MSTRPLDVDGTTIVLVGSFNPAIFQPAWFAAQGLLPKPEADDAKIEVVHQNVVAFSTELLDVQVTNERFFVGSARVPAPEMLVEFVVGTFTLLQHTPVRMLGMNRDAHQRLQSEDVWHSVGKLLVPDANWPTLKRPGMRSVMVQGEREDDYQGAVYVRVEPSGQIHPGLYINVNDHYDFGETDEPKGTSEALRVLDENWTASRLKGDEIIEQVLDLEKS